ncbi:phage tail spike protein [Sporosarcina sp. FSL K6-5500]|uniref:phage tail spike protein n=1 Tax=Sporosarcina sp. FSL K6-5500 TaxID=2921558 RepID=UPI0030FC35FB
MDGNKLIIHNATGIIGEIVNVINPEINEELNASYTFSFETVMDEKTVLLNYPNLIEVDGDYFQHSRIIKNRNSTVSVRIACDHVSYQLSRYPIQEDEEFDSSPDIIMNQLLGGTGFEVGTVEWLGNVEFKPSSKNVREALIELANYLDFELLWHKYTVSLVQRRGTDNNLEFVLGENLIGVTEEISIIDGYPSYAYEVDVLDLKHLAEYAFLATVNLGDVVRVLDPPLDIDTRLRVITYSRNPFQKINPQVSIGNRIRDFTDYVDELEENIINDIPIPIDDTIYIRGSSRLDATVNIIDNTENDTWLESYDVGGISVLSLPGLDETDGGSGGILEIEEPLDGIFIRLKDEYLLYYVNISVDFGDGWVGYNEGILVGGEIFIPGVFPENGRGRIEIIISDNLESWWDGEYKIYGLKTEVTEKPIDIPGLIAFGEVSKIRLKRRSQDHGRMMSLFANSNDLLSSEPPEGVVPIPDLTGYDRRAEAFITFTGDSNNSGWLPVGLDVMEFFDRKYWENDETAIGWHEIYAVYSAIVMVVNGIVTTILSANSGDSPPE